MSDGLADVGMETYNLGFERLTGAMPAIPQEKLGNLNKITKYMFESIMELSQQQGIKISQRKEI